MRRFLVPLAGLALGAIALPAVSASTGTPPPPVPTAPGPAAPLDPLAQALLQAEQQQAALAATKAALAGQVQAARDEQDNLAALVVANRKAIDDTLAKLATAEQTYNDASARATAEHAAALRAREREGRDRALLSDWLQQRYVHRDSALSYVVDSSSFSDLLSRAATLNHLADEGGRLVEQVRADIDEAETNERAAQADADAAAQAAAALTQQRADLEQQVSSEHDLIAQLDGQVAAAVSEIDQADHQDLALAQKISALRIQQLDQTIADAEQAAWQEATYYLQHHLLGLPPGVAVDAQHPASVRFVWPVPGSTFTQPFGPSPYDFEPPAYGYPHFHTGIDMAAALGTPVIAAGDGVVVAATQSNVGYGNDIVIAHDSHTLTLYGHLQTQVVHVGDTVHQGQLIGLVGSTGNSTGPHTHFEVRLDGSPVDPTPFMPPLPPGATGPPSPPRASDSSGA